MTKEGLSIWRSRVSAAVAVARLKTAIADAGLTLFAHIDQAAAAEAVGLSLAPRDLLLFGSPRAGTPMMSSHPTVTIDLPLKIIVWQDAEGGAWLAANDPAWIAARHGLGHDHVQAIEAMAQLQTKLAALVEADAPGDDGGGRG